MGSRWLKRSLLRASAAFLRRHPEGRGFGSLSVSHFCSRLNHRPSILKTLCPPCCSRSATTSAFSRPELDFDFILNPENSNLIRKNIEERKQVGDIDEVHSLWNRIQGYISKTDPKSDTVTEQELEELWNSFYAAALKLPNISHPSAPVGGEEDSKIVEQVNAESPTLENPRTAEAIGAKFKSYRPLNVTVGEKGFCLTGPLARIEEGLIKYTRDKLSRVPGMEEISVPDLVNENDAIGCGLVADQELIYLIADNESRDGSNRYCLSGTGEIGISRYISGRTFDVSELPLKFFTVSRCYRPEAKSGGVMNSGLYRVHEFSKVEMYGVTENESGKESEKMLQDFVTLQKEICTDLGLSFRVMEMSTKELGAPAFHKYDVEAWMPGRGFHGEVSSASNCTDYQARRLGIRYRANDGSTKFAHTVNATACATSRLMIALLETHQKKNWSLELPESLQRFMPLAEEGRTKLKLVDNNPRADYQSILDELKESTSAANERISLIESLRQKYAEAVDKK